MNDDNQSVKKFFFAHLTRQGFTDEHLAVYNDYFDFFLSHLGAAQIMDLEPEALYRVALVAVERLDGEEVIEAYLQMMEYFIEFWSDRWEALGHDESG